MKSFNDANEIVFNSLKRLKLKTEVVHILDSSNRVLAEDIYADIDMPSFDNSAMDGYAIKNINNQDGWKVIGEISAGSGSEYKLNENECVLIMTGARIPGNCDTIIPVEDTEVRGDKVFLNEIKELKKNTHIRTKASNVKKGEIVLKKGCYLTPKEIAVLGAFGKRLVSVYKKIKVGILQTGNELIDINEIPRDDKVRNSNYYSLLTVISDINAIPVPLGIAKDDQEILSKKIKDALNFDIDILLTIGGISAGKYDMVKRAFIDNDFDILVNKVNIKPGKPFTFGVYKKDKIYLIAAGLPGNPVSCLVNFIIFIKMNLDRINGIYRNHFLKAELIDELTKKDNKRHFIMGKLQFNSEDIVKVIPAKSQSSSNLTQLGNSDCLIVLKENIMKVNKGESVECIMI